MSKDEFFEKLKEKLLADNIQIVKVFRKNMTKNNGMLRDSLIVKTTDNRVTPAFNFDALYQNHLNGKSIDEVEAAIINRLKTDVNLDFLNIDTDEIQNYSRIKDRIIYRVINFAKNYDWLMENHAVYITHDDLAIVYYVLAYSDDEQVGSFVVSKTILESWKLSPDFVDMNELYQVALENMRRIFPMTTRNMFDTVCEILGNEELAEEIWAEEEQQMFIVSNSMGIQGATVMLYPEFKTFMNDLLEKYVAKMIYILPSSIHELIVLPAKEIVSATELKQIVTEVNEEVLSTDEYLSDNVYQYSKNLAIMIAE